MLSRVVIAVTLLVAESTAWQEVSPGSTWDVSDTPGEEKCQTVKVMCPEDDAFQTFDGTCNNLKHPTWGVVGTPHPRLLPAQYGDRVGTPRMSESNRHLPSTRRVSNLLKDTDLSFSSAVSHMHVLFGQLLAHDIVHTPVVKNSDGSKLDCNCKTPHEECINILIGVDDEQYIKANKTCMGLARSRPAEGLNGCKFPQREQTSTLSSVLDGTFVYGKTAQEAHDLRDPSSNAGELKTRANPIGGPHRLLPTQDMLNGTGISMTTDCRTNVHKPVDVPCFVAGDVRNNENTGLASIHTIWMRYHNKIAREMKNMNRHWSSDKVYREARRIIAAKMQIITYKEYLPPLLGPLWMKRMNLELTQVGYWNGYDDHYNPSITNEFTTAAFRYGHSQVAATLSRPGPFFEAGVHPDVKSEDSWFNSEPLLNKTGGGVGSIMRGFLMDKAESTDPTLTDPLRNQLFTEFGKKFGGDLFAINTQRGRDHGFPGYNKYRELCGLPRVVSFSELGREMSPQRVKMLMNVYATVDDIDLYPGGLSERHVAGGEVGPTFACILAYGFRALRKGDRYWHEYEFSPAAFSGQQLSELRKVTFARMLCDTGDEMASVTEAPMKVHSEIVSCASIPNFDLTPWRDMATDDMAPQNHGFEYEWTAWFVSDETFDQNFDSRTVLPRIKQRRPTDICGDKERMNHEVRRVPGDAHLQVRFSCLAGSIGGTDFPYQLSDQSYWTEWVVPKSQGCETDQAVYVTDFRCGVIAIQAQTRDGSKFARETGDVFEAHDASRGFVCRDKHQPWGECQRYRVRALCARQPPSPNAPLDKHAATLYCYYYGVCCDFGVVLHRRTTIPAREHQYARIMCATHGICCDA